LKDGRRRCVRCRYDWKPDRLPLRLTRRQWRGLLEWFVRGMTSAQIAHETHLERKRILRALTVVRSAMLDSVPEGVRTSGVHHPRHAHADDRPEPAGQRGGRPRPAVLGLRLVGDHVWAEVVDEEEAEPIVRTLRERKIGRELHQAMAPEYEAVVYRSRLYRLTAAADRSSTPFGHLEGFWAYLHHRLRSKGGIRRARLGLYLAEYAWRYNHRKLTPREQVHQLFKLIARRRSGVRTTPIAPRHKPGREPGKSPIDPQSET
jgi:hypothetical protein